MNARWNSLSIALALLWVVNLAIDDETAASIHADDQPQVSLSHQINVIAVAFPKNKQELITIGTRKDVRVKRWNLADGKLLSETPLLAASHGNRILMSGSAISPDGTLFVANDQNELTVWSTRTGEKIALLKPGNNVQIGALNFSEDSRMIVGGEATGLSGFRNDMNGYHWDIAKVHQFVQMSDEILGDKKRFEIQTDQSYQFPGALQIHHVAISKVTKRIALASQENGTALFDMESGKRLKILPNENGKKKHPKIEKMSKSVANQVLSVSFSPDGKLLATTDMFGVKIRTVSDGSVIHDLHKPFRLGRSRSLFSPDSRLLLRYKTDNELVVWDLKTGKQKAAFNTENQSAAFSRNGKSIAVGFSDRKTGISVYDLN